MTNENGGYVMCHAKEDTGSAIMGIEESGSGFVSVSSPEILLAAKMTVDGEGGNVTVSSEGGVVALMDVSEDGNGQVITWDRNGNMARLK